MRYLLPMTALLLPLSVLATSVQANDKQWFNSASYSHTEESSFNSLYLNSKYYFAEQQNTGIWDDYGYLDTDSNVSLSYTDNDAENFFSASGEAFYNNFFVNASVENLSKEDNHSIGFGYLYNDMLKLQVRTLRSDDHSDKTWFQAQYNHQLNESDYLGVTVGVQDAPDNWMVSTRYFKKLEGGSFFTIDASHEDYQNASSVRNIMANYYVDKTLAFGAGIYDSKLQLEAKYFLSDKYFYRFGYLDRGNQVSVAFNAYL
ncbi:putative porin [Pseudoalteromonas sp. S16_S37]|uniref:putative porin n=1 Tax=Pseudoalteromonas sp. S16_S37 TaxID=2720228 RepID=UPI00168055F8|nr:putative porin [Pseudoalteromonas sp. S16_S37]MBD1583948.1 putative porin [Pseudoalteromonas sp. S16_S37]